MNDPSSASLLALPEGGAELRLVVSLRWEDVAALGQEAGRLAAQLQRPVTLDEAASHRLRSRTGAVSAAATAPAPAAAAAAVKERTAGSATPAALGVRSPVEQARQAIEQAGAVPPSAARHASAPTGWTDPAAEASRAPEPALRRTD